MCVHILTLAFATIGRVSMVTRHASLAVGTSGEVTALFTHTTVHTCAVAITLASWNKGTKTSCGYCYYRKIQHG